MQLIWKDNENDLFHLKIYDIHHSWTGRFSRDFAEKYRERVKESPEEYRDNVKKFLTTKSDIEYDFLPVPGDTVAYTFSWKKKLGNSLIVHGAVLMHQDDDIEDDALESKDALIRYLIEDNLHLRQTAERYTKRIKMLNDDLDKCKAELEKFMNIKTSLEMSLYEKFIQLLNAKKKRVHILDRNLLQFEEAGLRVINEVD